VGTPYLAEDAALLLERARFPTAASVAALAIEEAGNPQILRQIALARNDREAAEAWRDYRCHTRKNAVWIFVDLVAGGARKLDDFKAVFDPNSDHPSVLDQVKQLGIYTDCLRGAKWSLPSAIIDESLARRLVTTATILATSQREVTETEIELWVKHIGPVWKGELSWMQKGLENWYAAMQTSGLVPKGENVMAEFIRRGITLGDKVA
jgi:AbiV family abortive infection protein